MNILIWHYICRYGFILCVLSTIGGFFLQNNILRSLSFGLIAALGGSGVLIMVLIIFKLFSFKCPKCKEKTDFNGGHKNTFRLTCSNCGSLEISGFATKQVKINGKDIQS